MFCSSSVPIHLLRGAAALALIAAALLVGPLGAVGSAAAFVGAVLLLRGCPMCWLMGLFETLAKRKPPAMSKSDVTAGPVVHRQ